MLIEKNNIDIKRHDVVEKRKYSFARILEVRKKRNGIFFDVIQKFEKCAGSQSVVFYWSSCRILKTETNNGIISIGFICLVSKRLDSPFTVNT